MAGKPGGNHARTVLSGAAQLTPHSWQTTGEKTLCQLAMGRIDRK